MKTKPLSTEQAMQAVIAGFVKLSKPMRVSGVPSKDIKRPNTICVMQ